MEDTYLAVSCGRTPHRLFRRSHAQLRRRRRAAGGSHALKLGPDNPVRHTQSNERNHRAFNMFQMHVFLLFFF